MKFAKIIFLALLQILATASVLAALFGVPYAYFACRIQPSTVSWTFGVVALVSLVFGRFFCRALCPLGAIQDLVRVLVHPLAAVRRVCTRLPRTRLQYLVNALGVLLAFVLPWLGFKGFDAALNPLGIFGRAVTLAAPLLLSVGLFVLILVLSAVGKGRAWCNWICPFGTLFHILSRFSPCKDRVSSRCAHCRACFPKEEKKASKSSAADGVTRRETLSGLAAVAVTEKVTDGGFAPVSEHVSPARDFIMPPGSRTSVKNYACIGCQICVKSCPGKCLKPLTRSGKVGLDFTEGYCLQDCRVCTTVCPAGVLKPLSVAEKRNTHMGVARWRSDLCLRTEKGEKCTACLRKCPYGALHLVGETIVVDADACVGCGACEHVCAARPEPAIKVDGLFIQKRVPPMGEEDLLKEMQRCLKDGDSLVIARDGVIRNRERGKGVAPTLKALDGHLLERATVCDRVVGRAAAAIFVVGGVRKVWAEVMGEDALELLRKFNIDVSAAKMVKSILNRDLSAPCPLEKAAAPFADPKRIVEALRANSARTSP